MKNCVIALTLIMAMCGCSATTPLMKHERIYEKTVYLEGIPKKQIFDRSLEWLALHVATSSNSIISDSSKWTITCSGRMLRPFSVANIAGIGELTYLTRESVQEEALTLSFELQTAVTPTVYTGVTYFSEGGVAPFVQADLGGAKKNFDHLADSLRKYLLSPVGDLK